MKRIGGTFFLLTSLFALISCSSSTTSTIDPNECKRMGYFCYKNINFGKSRGRVYEKGIIDGCTTAEGRFRKDYSLSSTSQDYFDGWMLGRSRCKQILPNEGTLQEEENSKKRAEYQIRKLKMEQSISNIEEEDIVDSLLNSTKEDEEVEY